MHKSFDKTITDIANRIRDMREIAGFTVAQMAEKTGTTEKEYLSYENGEFDFPFSFMHKCAIAFGIDITDILEGKSANLTSYAVTRNGDGKTTVDEDGIRIKHLASRFRNKIAEPYWVKYEYKPELQSKPIATSTHSGQEFDYVISGKLMVQVGDHTEVLLPGDSIYYDSSTPHGMIAVDGEDCVFCAVVLPGEKSEETEVAETIAKARTITPLLAEKFITTIENPDGSLKNIEFTNEDKYNFAFDTVDAIADAYPEKLAMVHVDNALVERRYTFKDLKHISSRVANYFTSLGIKRGDRVMLVLKRHPSFWFSILALHKIGAVAIPATNQLVQHDFEYRYNLAGVSAIICTGDGNVASEAERAAKNCPSVKTLIMSHGNRDGWHNFEREYRLFSDVYTREEDAPCGDDTCFMLFTSGTTGYPKIAAHSYKYALGHFITAKYWHCCERDGLHLTISDTGWGKALWGKLYGQWLCEGAVFVYDFDRFDANVILPMFKKYGITTFCAPPTMLRMMIKEDLSRFDFSSLHHITTAGEALNPEVFRQFEIATGHEIMEGFGQTETTLLIANLVGSTPKVGSMGKPSPMYNVDIVTPDGKPAAIGETGEIVVRLPNDKVQCGLFKGYYTDDEKTDEVIYDGMYHTGDTAWRDEDGYFWYVGRTDDVIKSSGYRIGPFEIESVIMELPYVLECGVSAVPDEVRGQVVKASIVLVKGVEGTDELKKEIQKYVKEHTAPYKYPRIVVFRDSLPKTISGKIQRNKL